MDNMSKKAWDFIEDIVLSNEISITTKQKALDLLLGRARTEGSNGRTFIFRGISFNVPISLIEETKDMTRDNENIITAVKNFRAKTNLGLIEAKNIVEMIRDNQDTKD